MPGINKFAKLTSVESALQALLNLCSPIGRTVKVDLEYADGRVVSRDVIAPRDNPHYDVCQVDGYAVRACDTAGCQGGRVLRPAAGGQVGHGTYVQVHTGGALPEGADAAVRMEDTDPAEGGRLFYNEVKAGENVLARGSILRKGDVACAAGIQLKPTDIALLAKLGLTGVEVFERPRVLIVPTGDELVERGKEPGPGTVNESNGIMCFLFIKRYGGKPALYDIVRDDPSRIAEALKMGSRYDLIVTTGGTSVGVRDRMEEVVSRMGKVLVHGVALKPGRPMGIGYVESGDRRTPIVFLPGLTEACASTMLTFVVPAIRKLGHYPPLHPRREKARLTRGLPGFPGANAFHKLYIEGGMATPVPLMGGAPRPGDYVYAIVPESIEKYEEGEEVETVYLE
ncbi:molybdopterin molybdotransferase MoeA [Methanocella conradii]|uniref:molybdopterin molybdotransferase MoeA n=1 Tax=Methanocella conradii TaxID=1175444 RepID=UPI0024B34931|nr:molybdopterin molybdotransferase MoeA [Methanocella conradii]MDI6898096.1 molybdopterin molybdotransferase MoeA [Methanocella conradii]